MPPPKRPPPRRCWNCASALAASAAARSRAPATVRMIDSVYSATVVDGVGRDLAADVVARLERIDRPGFCRDERGHVLRLVVRQAARVQVRHRVADDAGQRVDARRAGAVVPRAIAPERTGLLVADLHALAV